MFWIVIFIIFGIIATCLDSILGKVLIGTAVAAIGCLLLEWITNISFFIVLAKICAVVIVVSIVGAILLAIIG